MSGASSVPSYGVTGGRPSTVRPAEGTCVRKIRVAAAATTMSLLAAMGTLGTALGAVDTLLSGATIEVASMSGTSKSAAAAAQPAPAAPTATGQLPWTGGNGVQMAAVGAFLLALGLGFRHWLSMILRCD